MGAPSINAIEAALMELVRADATLSTYIESRCVGSIESGVDFDNMEIILDGCGVLFSYDGAAYESRNHDQSAYSVEERWTLIAVAPALRGLEAGKMGVLGERGVYDILEDLKGTIVKGRKLLLSTGKTVYLELIGSIVIEDLFYRFGLAALGLQIKAKCATWDYAA